MSTFLATTTAGGVAIFAGRAAVALGLGAMIGLERQWRQRMAAIKVPAGNGRSWPVTVSASRSTRATPLRPAIPGVSSRPGRICTTATAS